MSDDAEQSKSEQGSGFDPITSQDQLDSIISKRVERERAKFSDYDELKAKAAQLQQIEDASKSELEKAQETAASLNAEIEELRVGKVRAEVAAETGVPVNLIRGSDESEMREYVAELIAFRGEVQSTRSPKPDPLQGVGSGAHALNGDGLEQALRSKLGI